jgi:hypothetical protein
MISGLGENQWNSWNCQKTLLASILGIGKHTAARSDQLGAFFPRSFVKDEI